MFGVFFGVGKTNLLPTAIKFDKKLHSKPFFFNKSYFCIFNKKNCILTDNFSERPLNFCPLNCTYLGKNHFNFIRAWSEIMSLKCDQLEILLSVYKFGSQCAKYVLDPVKPFRE